MKKISYTKMREELADVLDMLRNGEDITITQRGRPDITISANREHYTSSLFISHDDKYQTHSCPGKSMNELHNLKIIINSKGKVSFKDAKEKTQTKHAAIIKALEDK